MSFFLALPGLLRDITGDYMASFVVSGCFLILSTLTMATLPHFFSRTDPPLVPAAETQHLSSETEKMNVSPDDDDANHWRARCVCLRHSQKFRNIYWTWWIDQLREGHLKVFCFGGFFGQGCCIFQSVISSQTFCEVGFWFRVICWSRLHMLAEMECSWKGQSMQNLWKMIAHWQLLWKSTHPKTFMETKSRDNAK